MARKRFPRKPAAMQLGIGQSGQLIIESCSPVVGGASLDAAKYVLRARAGSQVRAPTCQAVRRRPGDAPLVGS